MQFLPDLLFIDEQLFLVLNNLPHPLWLDQIFLFFSFYPLVLWMVVGGIVVLIEERREQVFIWRLILALVISGALASGIIKPLVRRPRPDIVHAAQVVIVEEKPAAIPWNNDFAFPSGHAAVAFAGAYVLMREETVSKHSKKHNLQKRTWLRIFFFSFALLTAFSRIYLGKHYPLDVIAGGFLGWGVGWMAWKMIDLVSPSKAY